MLRTPSFIDRADLAEDAEGRVAIFAVDDGSSQLPSGAGDPPGLGPSARARRALVALLDSRLAAPVFAVALVLLLLLGMLLTR